jgi:transposase-like protein
MAVIIAELVDTGEKRDLRGRRMTPAQRRAEVVEAYHASGLNMAQFARREGIKYGTFAGWVWKAQKPPVATKGSIKFAEVQMPLARTPAPDCGDRLEVRLPDGTVFRGGRVAEMVALVRALRS